MGNRQFDDAEAVVPSPADMLGVHVRHTLIAEPLRDFEIGDHQGASPLGDADHVADVVGVPVRDDD